MAGARTTQYNSFAATLTPRASRSRVSRVRVRVARRGLFGAEGENLRTRARGSNYKRRQPILAYGRRDSLDESATMRLILLALVLIVAGSHVSTGEDCKGCVSLDSYSFDKVRGTGVPV